MELAPCDLLLARANNTLATERSHGAKQACWRQLDGLLAAGTEQTLDPARLPRGGADYREQQLSGLGAQGLVCPGCGRSSVRGGVRCNNGGAEMCGGGHQAAAPTDHTDHMTSTAEVSTAGWARRSWEYLTPRTPTNVSSSTDRAAAGGTFHTSLGVIVDICKWQQQDGAGLAGAARGDRESNGCSPNRANGEQDTHGTAYTLKHILRRS